MLAFFDYSNINKATSIESILPLILQKSDKLDAYQIELNKPITIKEIDMVLSTLENNKVTGLDGISNEFYK